jgi:hypothetical protein
MIRCLYFTILFTVCWPTMRTAYFKVPETLPFWSALVPTEHIYTSTARTVNNWRCIRADSTVALVRSGSHLRALFPSMWCTTYV